MPRNAANENAVDVRPEQSTETIVREALVATGALREGQL
jgi:hypothetical protein